MHSGASGHIACPGVQHSSTAVVASQQDPKPYGHAASPFINLLKQYVIYYTFSGHFCQESFQKMPAGLYLQHALIAFKQEKSCEASVYRAAPLLQFSDFHFFLLIRQG